MIIFFLAVLGLRFCARAFSSCGKRGPLFIAVCGPLTVAASLVAEHRLQTRRLSSCGSRAQLLRGMWDLSGPGLEPVSPALAGRLSTTVPPGKPYIWLLNTHISQFICLLVSGHLGCFHVLAVVNNLQWTWGAKTYLRQWFHFLRYILRSGIADSYGSSIFNFFQETPYCFL